MTIPLSELFEDDHPDYGLVQSPPWNAEVFRRAYGQEGDAFDRVCLRLVQGFSVLVYLPGNCMDAATAHVKNQIPNVSWEVYGLHPGGKGSVFDEWRKSSGIIDKLREWATGKRPGTVFCNLDLLSDGRGGLYPDRDALNAVFSIVQASRMGVVLGLSDREAGHLPPAITRAFAEEVWLDAVEWKHFHSLIPAGLVTRFGARLTGEDQGLPEGTAWLLASRLRWMDPIRAVRIMINAAANQHDVNGLLREVQDLSKCVAFKDPSTVYAGDVEDIKGFQERTLDQIRHGVIAPFQRWADFDGATREACEAELARLPQGMILYGPPGTGKTLLAQWTAKCIGLPVREVNASDIKTSLFGDSERNVHRIFDEARRAAPCVLAFDDADDLLPDRASVTGAVAGAERGIVNAALQELQGFHGKLDGVLVILTTNRFDSLDEAAKGRLPVHIHVPYPLNKPQIREVVDAVASKYGIDFVATEAQLAGMSEADRRAADQERIEIKERLARRFFRAVDERLEMPDITKEETRLAASRNLYSPRHIEQAMLRFLVCSGRQADRAAVTMDDVAYMEKYLDSLK